MFETSDPSLPHRAYRAKLIHPDGGIETTVAIMASTLTEAEEQVRGLTNTYEVEIWDDGQMARRLPFQPPR